MDLATFGDFPMTLKLFLGGFPSSDTLIVA